jgi:hypothetical protein
MVMPRIPTYGEVEAMVPGSGVKFVFPLQPENYGLKTADLSTTLRSGRDDKFAWERKASLPKRIVISTGAQRSGEICGFKRRVRRYGGGGSAIPRHSW